MALTEAATAVVCRWRAVAGRPTDDVEFAWAARTPSSALREASRTLGRAYRRVALRLWPDAPALAELTATTVLSRPRVLGLVAAATGLSADAVARLVAYEDAQSVLAASLKRRIVDYLTGLVLERARCAIAEGRRVFTDRLRLRIGHGYLLC